MANNTRFFSRTSHSILLLACIASVSLISLQCGSKNAEHTKGFAVVELFTSEGCAYCPPAHELLSKILQENPTKKIYALAYHVDFWDRKKWKDRFSNAQFSKRQISYAEWLNVPNVYAPQIVLNGRREFVGTDSAKIRRYINELLTISSKATLSVQPRQDESRLELDYKADGVSENSQLQVAIVKKSSDGVVEEGKDINHHFTHVQTVRDWHSEPLTKDGRGSVTLKLPQGFNAIDWEVIAMIQDLDKKGHISTAIRVDL